MHVPFADIAADNLKLETQLIAALQQVNAVGRYILEDYVQHFERELCKLTGCQYAIAVNSGTDALFLALKALNIGTGDEVITVANSFVATAGAIAATGATPIFVDINNDLNINTALINASITTNTRAILPVHLTGKPADMNAIVNIAKQHNLYVVEDAAQAFGATLAQQTVGTFGDLGCFSFHPFKVLAGLGDGGAIVTNNQAHYHSLLALRNHGIDGGAISRWGYNSRLDAIQAAWLLEKLPSLNNNIKRRQQIASYYNTRFAGKIDCPTIGNEEQCAFQTYIIKIPKRAQLIEQLQKVGIETAIHYPVPIHMQPVCSELGYAKNDLPTTEDLCHKILSLPIYPTLSDQQMTFVADHVLQFAASS